MIILKKLELLRSREQKYRGIPAIRTRQYQTDRPFQRPNGSRIKRKALSGRIRSLMTMITRFSFSRTMSLVWRYSLLAAALLLICGGARAQNLEPIKYNNPGLVVDLGVGLWAWPVPCDADGDGDFDLIVSCPDKPSNGVWLFENVTGDTAKNKAPVFKPGRRLSSTRPYVTPSYVNGRLRVLTPGQEYADFEKTGLQKPIPLPVDANFYKPEGKQPKGPKVRHNQWRYVDFDGDGALDLVTGIEDWSFYGWDDAWNEKGEWINGPLRGFVLAHRNTGTNAAPQYAASVKLEADGKPIDVFGCPSPNFEDFDGDGDLDLLCGEFLDGFTYFENVGSRTKPRYAASRRLKDTLGAKLTMDLQMIVPVAFDWDTASRFALWPVRTGAFRDQPRPSGATPRSTSPIGTLTVYWTSSSIQFSAVFNG